AGLFLDGSGALYVADSGNDRIRRLVPTGTVGEELAPLSVVNALSGTGGSLAPGELVRVSGDGLTAGAQAQVRFDSRDVPVLSTDAGQLVVQVPEELGNEAVTRLEVRVAGRIVGATVLAIAEAAPGVLALTPASPGATITLIATGLGKLESAR